MLELMRQTAEAARAAGKWAGVCGELGGDPRAIPRAKQIIRELELPAARQLALEAVG